MTVNQARLSIECRRRVANDAKTTPSAFKIQLSFALRWTNGALENLEEAESFVALCLDDEQGGLGHCGCKMEIPCTMRQPP